MFPRLASAVLCCLLSIGGFDVWEMASDCDCCEASAPISASCEASSPVIVPAGSSFFVRSAPIVSLVSQSPAQAKRSDSLNHGDFGSEMAARNGCGATLRC